MKYIADNMTTYLLNLQHNELEQLASEPTTYQHVYFERESQLTCTIARVEMNITHM